MNLNKFENPRHRKSIPTDPRGLVRDLRSYRQQILDLEPTVMNGDSKITLFDRRKFIQITELVRTRLGLTLADFSKLVKIPSQRYNTLISRSICSDWVRLETRDRFLKALRYLIRSKKSPLTAPLSPEQISSIRRGAGLSKSAFAEAVGVSRITVHNWETGAKQISPKYIHLLLSKFKEAPRA